MKRILSMAMICCTAISIVRAGDTEIIIESYADGYNGSAFKAIEGKWNESVAKSQAQGLLASKSVYNDADTTGAASAEFRPNIPTEGQYEVFVTYPQSGNAAGVVYAVTAADGVKEVRLDQAGRVSDPKSQPDTWISIGTYNFKTGTDGAVTVRDPQTGLSTFEEEPNKRIYADAIKLTPVGFSLPENYANVAPGVPSGATAVAAAPTPGGQGLPPLPGAELLRPDAQAPALPPLPAATPVGGTAPALPPLPAATPVGTDLAALPALPGATPATGSAPLPTLPAATPVTEGAAALPSLPDSTPATSALPSLPSGTPAAASAALPTLPGATPDSGTAALPTLPGSTPASGTAGLPSLPGAAAVTGASNMPALPNAPSGTPALPQLPTTTPSNVASVPTVATPNAMSAPVEIRATPQLTPTLSESSITNNNPAGLDWTYDYGSATNAARVGNKNLFVFFTASNNKGAETYENTLFQDPAVKAELDKYVLLKVDFPKFTRLGYTLGVYGSGIVALANPDGEVLGRIDQAPASGAELITKMQSITTPPPPAAQPTPSPSPAPEE